MHVHVDVHVHVQCTHLDRPVEDKVGRRKEDDVPVRRREVAPTGWLRAGCRVSGAGDGVKVETVAALEEQLVVIGLQGMR